jgi:hypothetical protein
VVRASKLFDRYKLPSACVTLGTPPYHARDRPAERKEVRAVNFDDPV